MHKLYLLLLISLLATQTVAKRPLLERKRIPRSIDTSLRVTSENAEKMLIRIIHINKQRFYMVNGKVLPTKRKIKNNLDYTIPFADDIRRATNVVGIGVGFATVTVIPFSKLLGVPLWGEGLNNRDFYIDKYNQFIIEKYNLDVKIESFYNQ